MKILQVMPGQLSRGGIGSVVEQLCGSLSKQGHEVTVYELSKELDESGRAVNEKRFMVKRFKPELGDPFYVPPRSLMKELAQTGADIIHVHNLNTLLPACVTLSKNRLRGTLLLQPHYHRQGQNFLRNLFFSVYKTYLRMSVLGRYDAIVANSEHERKILEEDFPNVERALTLIPEEYSIEAPPYAECEPSHFPRKVLYVGALRKYKRVDIVIHAFKILALKRHDIKLVIVGRGPEKRRLRQLSRKLEIDEQVVMKDNLTREELWREYSSASVVVVLSSLESFSRVAHEAAAAGVPLVVHNRGALTEFVETGSAFGTETLEPREVAEAINEALDHTRKKPSTIRTSDGDKYAIRMLELYQRLRQHHD
jgi:glycosyltransferase involved in cell wall biosynthesis